MSGFKVTIGGMQIEVSRAEDVAELARVMGIAGHGAKSIKKEDNSISTRKANKVASRHIVEAISFLSDIMLSGEIDSSRAQVILKATPKGVGPKTRSIDNLIRSLGFEVDDVYTSDRDEDGRHWYVGDKINEAIDAIKKMLGE